MQLKKDGVREKGNGTYPRSFKSLARNSMIINIPRTRYTDFKPLTIEILKYQQEQVNDLVLKLYRKGLTCRDISETLKDFFGEEISYSQVSNLAERFNELRLAWQNSPLDTYYKVIFMDAIYITVKRENSYAKEPVHIIYGVRSDNKRELLYLDVNPTESATSWGEGLAKLKERGVKKIDLIVADGLPALEDQVHQYFPGAAFQKCVVHKIRGSLNKVRPNDKQNVANDLKEVFDNFDKGASLEAAKAKLQSFVTKWKSTYPSVIKTFDFDEDKNIEYYFTYIKFPCEIRRMIYTTNSIESLNKKIRKATKNKQSFDKVERLLDYLFIVIKDFEAENWMKYPVNSFSAF
ncbi:MAG: IS256 family transposase [Rickettsiaceae bacterium]|nr:IS256 family transposase [Rickettsiaceae bacterium]